MNWQLVYNATHLYGESPVTISQTFTSKSIIVWAASAAAQPSWQRAGSLYQIIDAPGIGKAEGERRKAILGTKYIEFLETTVPFELGFIFVPWLPSLSLKIWVPEP